MISYPTPQGCYPCFRSFYTPMGTQPASDMQESFLDSYNIVLKCATHTHTNAIDKNRHNLRKRIKLPKREMKRKGQNPPSFSQHLLYSQEGLTHGAGVAMHLPIWALDRIVLSGAWEFPISHKLAVFTAYLLPK